MLPYKIKFWLLIFPVFGLLALLAISGCTSSRNDADQPSQRILPVTLSREVRDIDSNLYHTVKIGRQEWLVENLKVTRYQNGDPIPNVQNAMQWRGKRVGAYCNYDNDPVYSITYGRLYNWYAVADNRSICPKGWHVPSDEEWFELTAFLGGESVAGGKLKEAGLNHWSFPNYGATNESGFQALPGGYRGNMGRFQILDDYSFYWTTSSYDAASAWSRFLQNDYAGISRIENFKTFGFSVRCLKDR